MNEGPIDRYLDELFSKARSLPARQARTLVTEAEAHLFDARDDGIARGLDPEQAEVEAVARFGAVDSVVGAEAPVTRPISLWGLIRSGWLLGSVGAIAVGVSGLLAGLFRLAGATNNWMVGGHAVLGVGRSSCGRWMHLYPHAATCAQAALADAAFDTVFLRVGLGVLGLLGLAAYVVALRVWPALRRSGSQQSPLLQPVVIYSAAGAIFALVGVWLAGMATDALFASGGTGVGQWLSAAPVALIVAGCFGLEVLRDLNRRNAAPG